MQYRSHALIAGFCAITLYSAGAVASEYGGQERWPRWYVGLNGSVTFVSEADLGASSTGELDLDTGWGLGATLGYEPPFTSSFWGNSRFEVEYIYQENDLGTADVGGTLTVENGQLTAQAFMLNGFYDIRAAGSNFVPYIGGGVGWAMVEMDRLASVSSLDDEDSVFAWQLMLGLGYEPDSLPSTLWSVGYRYFTTADLKYSLSGGGTVEVDYDSHRIDVGARFRF